MSSQYRYIILGGLFFLCLYFLFSTQDLDQKNKETIFLTKKGVEQYRSFKKSYDEKSIVVVLRDLQPSETSMTTSQINAYIQLLESECGKECEVISSKSGTHKYGDIFTLKGEGYLGLLLVGHKEGVAIKKLIQFMQDHNFWSKSYFSGIPYTNLLLDNYSETIKTQLFPALFIGILIFLIFLTSSILRGVLLFIPCLLGAATSLFCIKLFLGHTNLISSIVPVLIFVLSLSLVLHVYYTAVDLQSIKKAIRGKKKPLSLMVLTTFIGFSSLYFSELQTIQEFGVLTALLILVSSAFSITWLFLIEGLFILSKRPSLGESLLLKIREQITNPFKFRGIVVSSIIFIVLGFYFLQRIPIVTDANQYFPKHLEMKSRIDLVSEKVSGIPLLEIVLSEKPEKIDNLETEIIKLISSNDHHMSLMSSNQFSTYMLKQKLSKKDLAGFDDLLGVLATAYADQGSYRMTILSSQMNVDEFEAFTEKVEGLLNRHQISHQFNGLYYHLMLAQKKMILTLFKSFLLSLFVISFLAFIFFRKIKLFFIFMFVNIVPVFASFTLLYCLGISFNIATVMIYSISLGLIVDSSFHIIHALESISPQSDTYFNSIVLPIVGGSMVLCISFLFFAINDFVPIQQFGVCLAIMLFLGMIYDLKVLPRLYKA